MSIKTNARKKILSQISSEFELDTIYAFGSQAEKIAAWLRGHRLSPKIPPLSDVDIGVKLLSGKKLSIKQKVQLSIAFEDLFSVNRVDLVVIPEADPFLAANIIRGQRIYCREEYAADEYELYILRRAGDLAPLERERIALIMGKD